MTPHLTEIVQMRGHNICFYAELTKIIPHYHQILICSFGVITINLLKNILSMSVSVIRHERIGGDDCGDVCVCAGWERGGGQNV